MEPADRPEEAPPSEVGSRSVSAVKWGVAATLGRYGLQLLAQVTLARLLGPEVYGVFGLGLVVFTFSSFIGSFGFGWALMQLERIDDRDVRFAFTWQLLAGCVAALVLLVSADFLAGFFDDPRVEPVVRWLALACVLDAASSASGHLLKRRLDFKTIGVVDVLGYLLGYLVVGIPAALAGAGVFALVAAWLIQATVKAVGYYAAARHDVRPLFRHPGRGGVIMGMGATVFVTTIVNWLLVNLDRVVLGRVLDVAAVGLYTVAFNLASTPNGLLIGSIQPAFLAAGARVQEEPERIRRAYEQVIATVLVLVVPPVVFLATVAPDTVLFLYGDDWREAGGVLRILFLGMPIFLLWAMSTPVLWNTGRHHYEAMLQAPLIVIVIPLLYAAASIDVTAVAWAMVLIFALRASVVGFAAARAVGLRVGELRGDVLRSVGFSVLAAGSALVGLLAVRPLGQPLASLTAATVTTTLLFASLLWLRPALLGDRSLAMVRRFLPDSMAPWLDRGGRG